MNPLHSLQHTFSAFFRSALFALLSLLAIGLGACGGGGSSTNSLTGSTNSCTSATCGSAMLSLTDAQGDFLTYTVDVASLKLQRADGTTVETLPVTTRVDFATLVSLSEIIGHGQIPPGNYSSASVTLDYSNANIVVDDGSASGLKVAAVDSSGAALGQITMSVQLDSNHHMAVSPGVVSSLSLDFNLLASNTVDLANAKVTVSPVLVASLVPPTDRQMRVRGSLVSVDTLAGTYTVNVRPFHNGKDSAGHQLTVKTTSTTAFAIDGSSYTGSAGLTQLASKAAGTLVVAFGAWSSTDKSFTAAQVLAGSSVVSPTQDSVEGDVIARNGNTLTVKGATWSHAGDDGFEFERGSISVTVGSNTKVTKSGHTGSFSIDDISVGQRVVVFGTATIANGDVTSLDATAGSARMLVSGLWGNVTSKTSNSVTLSVQALDGWAPSTYTFAGTGSNPSGYVVGTSTLDLSGVSSGNTVRFLGFVSPFGSATSSGIDFNAETLINYAATNGVLSVRWEEGVATPFTSLSTTAIGISQTMLDTSHEPFVRIGPQIINLLSSASHTGGVTILPPDASSTAIQYAISHVSTHKVESFAVFADFETALQNDIAVSGTLTMGVAANGAYDSTMSTLKANQAIVVLNK